MPSLMPSQKSASYESSGGRLVAADGRTLPLLGASLRAEARGGIARAVLEQRFRNPYSEPLAVSYLMPLPADGAVSGYAFRIGERRIQGEVDRKQAARERFEQAIADGRTAGLVEQERSSLFTQEIGNIPAGAEVVAELTVDQKLSWLPDGAWEWRFPTVVAPRYLGEEGRVPDAGRITAGVADKPLGIRMGLSMTVRDELAEGRRPESPSHALRAAQTGGLWELSFGDDPGARLDRDVVVRWAAAGRDPGLSIATCRPAESKPHSASAYGLLTVVPPAASAAKEALPRDLILLIDTSGSMSGEPLAHSQRVASALVDSLGESDRLEMIEFSSSPSHWKAKAVEATAKNKADALGWISKLRASGGTEMRSGILAALEPLRGDAQRQVVLLTDGLIGSEQEVLQAILERLPAPSRVHVVGVGSGVNRSLTLPASRAGRGVEVIIGIGEDAERAANRIVSRTRSPLLTEVSVSGSAVQGCAPARIPDVFAGAPLLAALKLRPEGGELVIKARLPDGAAYERKLRVDPVHAGEGTAPVAALYARERVEDLELEIAGGADQGARDEEIERLGIGFQISTRLTSWVAVSDERTVDPTSPTRREAIPQELPYGMSVEGLGLRRAMMAPSGAGPAMLGQSLSASYAAPAAPPPPMQGAPAASAGAPRPAKAKLSDILLGRADRARGEMMRGAPPAKSRPPVVNEPAPDVEFAEMETAMPKGGMDEGEAPLGTVAARVSGRVLTFSGTELIIEIAVGPEGLSWAVPPEAWVVDAAGQIVHAAADASRTTRAVQASPGMVLRLALKLDAKAGRPVVVRIGSASDPALEIVL